MNAQPQRPELLAVFQKAEEVAGQLRKLIANDNGTEASTSRRLLTEFEEMLDAYWR